MLAKFDTSGAVGQNINSLVRPTIWYYTITLRSVAQQFVLYSVLSGLEIIFPQKQSLPNTCYQMVYINSRARMTFGISYIGETKRHFISRVKEHLEINKTTKSEVKTHI